MSEVVPKHLQFPKTLNEKKWIEYLERHLEYKEKCIINSVRIERSFNKDIEELYTICKKKRMYIPELTNMDGNCLFESLNYHGIGRDVNTFRTGLSILMYYYKTTKNFFPHQESSLEELFNTFNEVEYAYSVRHIKEDNIKDYEIEYYKYTYNVMCQDLQNNGSWSRLPTQLILMVISLLYKLNIVIINNSNDYEMNVNVYENVQNKPHIRTIYLGNLGESHYLPIDLLQEDEEIDPLYYTEAVDEFLKWAKYMQDVKVRNYNLEFVDFINRDTKNNKDTKDNKDTKNNKDNDDFIEVNTTDNIGNVGDVDF